MSYFFMVSLLRLKGYGGQAGVGFQKTEVRRQKKIKNIA
jgi:hypothetical protein